jgi:hypothetical protein
MTKADANRLTVAKMRFLRSAEGKEAKETG